MSNEKNCENCCKSSYELGSSLLLQKIVCFKMFGNKQYPKLARVVKIGNEFHFSISVNGYELEHCTAVSLSELGSKYADTPSNRNLVE
jgi:hypothetical protein